MKVTFAPRGILQMDEVRLTFRNFEGRGDQYNREGDRNFAIVIPDRLLEPYEIDNIMDMDRSVKSFQDEDGYTVLMINGNEVKTIAEALMAYDWNVKIKPPRTPEESPFMYLKVNVKFNDRGPAIYLETGKKINKLTEATVRCLDKIDILYANLDIRPYDWSIRGETGRTAYLQSGNVVQDIDRFSARFAEEEFPTE